jgi:2-polyprenylphenol 6-hydroxylase
MATDFHPYSSSASPTPIWDIAVIGSGPVGAAMALAATQLGYRTACVSTSAVDPSASRDAEGTADSSSGIGALEAPSPEAPSQGQGWDPRIYALSISTRDLLTRLRIWDALDHTRIAPVHDMRIYPSAAINAPALHVGAYEARQDALAWIVEGKNLNDTFRRALSFSSVSMISGRLAALATSPDSDAATLTLDDGATLRARLVIGADSAQSPTRALAGLASTEYAYPHTAVVANFETERPHQDGAWQWFGDHGILALLPLPGNRCGIVWSAPHALAEELCALSPDDLAQRVAHTSNHTLGALKLLTPAQSFALRRIDVPRVIADRVVLVGDAAHVVHPLAGQGMNLGFGDVAALTSVLAGREHYRDLGDRMFLRRYERARKEAVVSMRWTTHGLQRLFDREQLSALGPLSLPVEVIRDLGWRIVAGSPWLRSFLARSATG